MAIANASANSGLLTLERELQCFICTELLFQPLTLIDCLHTFCGACLKEWFGHQHKKASSSRSSSTSNPYTCPTCRATVKDARHNATVTTLLDMFLTANPTRGRTKEEEAEQLAIYKPGDAILPKVEPRRRREGRSRREEDDVEAQDRRLLEEARQRSLRELENQESRSRLNVPGGAAPRSSSRGHEERRTRRREQERAERRRRVEAAEQANARERDAEAAGIALIPPVSPPQSSPRHPEAVEARQRDSTVTHQPSLISLMSASESSTGTGDTLNTARIMQEILAEGLLEGINADELTEQEQDELSERIAEAYRQRHQRTGQASPPPPQTTDNSDGIPQQPPSQITGTREDPVEGDGGRRQARSRSHQPSSTGSSRSRDVSIDVGRPPTSRPHLLDVADSPGSARSSAHRRRASDQNRRQTSPAGSSSRANPVESSGPPAIRSATDLSDAPSSDRGSSRTRPRQLSGNRRTNTEPQTTTRASELWRQGGRESSPAESAESTAAVLPVRPLAREAIDPSPPKDATTVHQRAVTVDLIPQPAERPQVASTNNSPQSQKSPLHVPTRFQEPSISCARCSRQEIQYELYKHCPTCKMDLCLRCYRTSRGCDHWFGFGKKAQANFLSSQSADPTNQSIDPPHVLVGRKYLEAPPGTIQAPGVPLRSTTSNPAERLQEGHFCDRCHSFANACFWSCDYCNEGEWGFCNDCVNTHKCCVHPLLPLAHRSFAPKSPSSQDQPGYDPHISNAMTPADLHAAMVTTPTQSRPNTAESGAHSVHHDEHPDYVTLSFKTDCDICTTAIAPADSRYHCPSHSTPTSQNPQKAGDYDICMPCYHQLVDTGKIKRDYGPGGWRKCRVGHRMIVVAFEEDTYMHQRRIVQLDLVGGHLLDPNETIGPRSRTGSMNASGSRFPPVGGTGKTYAAMWSYYPEMGEEGSGELMFPKWAEIRECEDRNEDWAVGVYMGNQGLVPRAYVREWQG